MQPSLVQKFSHGFYLVILMLCSVFKHWKKFTQKLNITLEIYTKTKWYIDCLTI